MSTPVLAFEDARLALGAAGRISQAMSLELGAGALAILDPQGEANAAALADACLGLVAPRAGRVLFQGTAWTGMAEPEPARARIGRNLPGGGFLGHLSVLDNLTLAARFHAGTALPGLAASATTLCRLFGLPGVPTGLPAEVAPDDLARAALARAFLGRPALVVLEEPRRFIAGDITAVLVAAIRRVRDRGGAVLWLTRGGALSDRLIPADHRLRLVGGRLLAVRTALAA